MYSGQLFNGQLSYHKLINGNADRPNFSGFIADYSADGEMMHNYGSFDTYQSFVDLVNDYFGEEFFATEQE